MNGNDCQHHLVSGPNSAGTSSHPSLGYGCSGWTGLVREKSSPLSRRKNCADRLRLARLDSCDEGSSAGSQEYF